MDSIQVRKVRVREALLEQLRVAESGVNPRWSARGVGAFVKLDNDEGEGEKEREKEENVVVPVKDRKRRPVEGQEEIQFDDTTSFRVPLALLSLSADGFRDLLKKGWDLLTTGDRDTLQRQYLPPITNQKDTPTTALLAGTPMHFGSPVDHLYRRMVMGLYHPRVVAAQRVLFQLGRKVAQQEIERGAVRAKRMREAAAAFASKPAGGTTRSLQWISAELDDDFDTAESQLTHALHAPASIPKPRFGVVVPNAAAPGRSRFLVGTPVSGGNAVAPGEVTRAQKKMQSRIVDGVFTAAFTCFIRVRDALRKAPLGLTELTSILISDGCFAGDPVEGLSVHQLINVTIAHMGQQTVCHKERLGPYIASSQGDLSKVVWIDDSQDELLDVLMELENAEMLFRYALSRNFVDMQTGSLSGAHIKDLKNNPVSVKRLPADMLAEFHKQEKERYGGLLFLFSSFFFF